MQVIRARDQLAFEKWNEQIKFQLIDSKLVEKACIVDKSTGQVWGTTPNFGVREM